MEFCFFKDGQDGAWKLDWQQFARYQPVNWEDFVRGNGAVSYTHLFIGKAERNSHIAR